MNVDETLFKMFKIKKIMCALIIFIYSYFFDLLLKSVQENFVQNFAYKLFKNKIIKR